MNKKNEKYIIALKQKLERKIWNKYETMFGRNKNMEE